MCKIVRIFKHIIWCMIDVYGKGKTGVVGGMPVLLPVSHMEWSEFICVDDNF